MNARLERIFFRLVGRRRTIKKPYPMLVELFEKADGKPDITYESFPFSYNLSRRAGYWHYGISCRLSPGQIGMLRQAVLKSSDDLDPAEVEPLTFGRLIEVLSQLAAGHIEGTLAGGMTRELSELVAYEAVGLSRILAFAKDKDVTEFFVDSEESPLYLDHASVGRCETRIVLTARERSALETHLDTFRGYTLDYLTPSLKNDLDVSGARLRISLDLEPIAVNRFALDIRRLNAASLPLGQLINLGVVSQEAAAVLVAWLEAGGNVTIVGETGTGKTTLLNALDEQLEPKLRRLYIEDAVETTDLLERGYHQMKVKVDPLDRGGNPSRTKESEIVKALHRSPDIVILSEIQSEEHSRAFFHALAAGVRGIQTFHASTVEQAIGRWLNAHRIPEQSLLDLGVIVQMVRPDKLGPGRFVQRICAVASDVGRVKVRELFLRDRGFGLRRVGDLEGLVATAGMDSGILERKMTEAAERIRSVGVGR